MRILLTGANGYIGKQLIPILLNNGHEIICCVRNIGSINTRIYNSDKISAIEVDFLAPKTLDIIPKDIDVAYYLIHSMASEGDNFLKAESEAAENFKEAINKTNTKQVIYLSGIVNEDKLSKHLNSRKNVEQILSTGSYNLTTLRAGIIIGSGSASFEIIRDLVEKLPLMIAPRWLKTPSQPISITNILQFLVGVLQKENSYGKNFDIGGPDILTYKQMLLGYAKVRGLKRRIGVVPVMTPKLSSYWLYFITSTSYKLAQNLVDSMKIPIVCRSNTLSNDLNISLLSYDDAIRNALGNPYTDKSKLQKFAPDYGCLKDYRTRRVVNSEISLNKIWSIGGVNGWYYANWLWEIRGFIDKIFGGVGLRRGRANQTEISAGDTLDFWRVAYANKEDGRLLLFAEMKLPGEAWLEFRIDSENILHQTATFRPLGLLGRAYWYTLLPIHNIIFNGMIRQIAGK